MCFAIIYEFVYNVHVSCFLLDSLFNLGKAMSNYFFYTYHLAWSLTHIDYQCLFNE